ncbi:MAG: ComEC/Rec2 family competence protein [Mycoplasmoidaceae bacterium]
MFNKLSFPTIIIGVILALASYILAIVNENNKIMFGRWIDAIFNYSFRDATLNFIKDSYSYKSSSLILISGFSEKAFEGFNLYKLFLDLSISHLIVVSGYHLSFVSRILNKLNLRKNIKLCGLIIFLIFANYNLDFNFGILRSSIFALLTFEKKRCSFQMLSLSSIVILIFCPRALTNFSFLMSYLATYLILILNKKLTKGIIPFLTPFLISIFLSPILSQFTTTISITGMIFSFLYSNIFCILFLITTICFPLVFLDGLFSFIFDGLNFLLQTFNSLNIKIPIIELNVVLLSTFYLCFFFYLRFSIMKNDI